MTWENSPEAIKVGAKSLEVEGLVAVRMGSGVIVIARESAPTATPSRNRKCAVTSKPLANQMPISKKPLLRKTRASSRTKSSTC